MKLHIVSVKKQEKGKLLESKILYFSNYQKVSALCRVQQRMTSKKLCLNS